MPANDAPLEEWIRFYSPASMQVVRGSIETVPVYRFLCELRDMRESLVSNEGEPTEPEIELTLALYNSMQEDAGSHVLREHWESWWDHPIPRTTMWRYVRAARRMMQVARERGLKSA